MARRLWWCWWSAALVLLNGLAPAAAAGGPCQWTPAGKGAAEDDTLECSLRILDFRRNSTDTVLASAIGDGDDQGVGRQPRLLRHLRVSCSSAFFFESQLRSDHFGHLPSLLSLEVDFCKIRQLPPRAFVGLSSLRALAVRTRDADWSSLVLRPDYESLVGLGRLEDLDLTLNNLDELPGNLLCPLSMLRRVNLSGNALADLDDLGLRSNPSEECRTPQLESLVLSHNRVSSVTPGSLKLAAGSLAALDLSHNDLGVLVEDALLGLSKLRRLDLSHNQLVSLPPGIFSATPALSELRLANNSVGTLDLRAFSNLNGLQVLDLSGNRLDENWVKPGLFDGLRGLILLDLSANHISRIEPTLLKDLGALQVLNLGHNFLRELSSSSLSSLLNLHVLSLSSNRLESVHQHALSPLAVLHSLDLSHNRLHSLHPAVLRNCTGVREVYVGNNLLTQVPEALAGLPSLTTLDLSSNVIGVLKRSSLQGLPSLARLKIGRNELSRVGEGAFKEVPALQSLDLGGNRFRSLDQETFAPLPSLESLNLAGNQLEDINGLLQAQTHLKWLNVSGNRLAWFDFAFVPPSVEWLDVAGNRIDALGNYYNLLDNYRLRYFDASRNRVKAVGPTGLLPSMEHVFLADNLLETVEPGTFVGKYSLRQVHLQGNRLESLDGSALTVTPQTETPVFYLSGNPLVCDCRLQWLKRVNAGGPGDSRFPRVADLDAVRCRVLNHTGAVEERPVSEVGDRDFLCEYEKHCLPGCMCCDFFACDCQMKCPEGCRCYRDGEWAANVAQCSSAGFGRVPEVVPMDATVLYLDGNNLTELTPGVLVGRSRLRRLSAREAGVARIANQSFAGLVSLQVLDLGRNQLKTLAGYEFSELRGLRELHLDHNQLVSMAAHTFRALRHLTVLTLHGNLLISFPIWQLSSNPQLKTMTLADNWWQCDCDFVRKFRMFIDGNMDIIPDASRITCTSSSVDKLNQCSGVLSGGGVGGFRSTQGVMGALVPLAAGLAALAVVAVVSLAAAVKMRGSLLVWLHYKYGIRLTCGEHRKKVAGHGPRGESSGDEGGGDLFDALVLYSTKDEGLVQDELVKQLEPSYRLCLLHRDLSGIYTSETFKSALTASSRVIVVFSQGLFAGEWEYVSELGLQGCLVIVAGDLAASEVEDRAARDMMRRARKVLEWGRDSEEGRQIFWRKLKYHLPDPTKISGREGGAELDISGVWTFTPMEGVSNNTAASPSSPRPPKGANDTNASAARLLRSPADSPLATRGGSNGRLASSSTPLLAATLASAGNSPVLLHFPAPPVRKQPHQCSTHYLAGAPSSSSNNSSLSTSKLFTAGSPGVPEANPLHQRSMSNEVYPAHHLPPNTRSCGTNAVHANAGSHHHHQRSVSAIDDGRKALVAGLPKSRSIVCGQIPPTPPPKIRHKNSFYNFQSPQQAQPQPESIYNLPRSSILQQLVSSSSGPPFGQPSPELLLRPQPVGQAADPQEPSNSSSSLAMIPLRAAAEHPHRRSSSLLDHQGYGARQSLSGSHHLFAKQQQSTALARRDPPPPAPHRRSASGIGVSRTASMLVSSEANNVAAHHKSALNLMARKELLNSTASSSSPGRQQLGGQQQHKHARSRSTPFKEGFVL